MLWAYFDDSSDAKKERFCAAGGLYTLDSVWKRLEIEWSKLTHELTHPFRSTDCENGFGQFKYWPKSKRDTLMADLCDLIKSFDLGAFGSAISVRDYKSVFPEAGKHDPYYLCIGMCFANIAEITFLANRQTRGLLPPTKVHTWVEENRDTATKATQIYYDLRSLDGWEPALTMVGIEHSPKGLVGLQAADLIAREVFKYYDNKGIRPLRKPVISLAQNVSFQCWTEQNIREYAALGNPTRLFASAARRMTRGGSTLLS